MKKLFFKLLHFFLATAVVLTYNLTMENTLQPIQQLATSTLLLSLRVFNGVIADPKRNGREIAVAYNTALLIENEIEVRAVLGDPFARAYYTGE